MGSVGGEHVEDAVAQMLAALTPRADDDWQVPAGSLAWSCWQTASHVAHDLASYAGQVAGRVADGYLPVDVVVAPGATPAEVLHVVASYGRLLSLAVDGAGAGPVAWHWGASDAAGFAAMGVAETLVHTYDITQGLGIAWVPPSGSVGWSSIGCCPIHHPGAQRRSCCGPQGERICPATRAPARGCGEPRCPDHAGAQLGRGSRPSPRCSGSRTRRREVPRSEVTGGVGA